MSDSVEDNPQQSSPLLSSDCIAKSKEECTTEDGVKLKAKISLFNACAIIIGVIIGSGIFVSPKGVLQQTGSPFVSIVLWGICGLYSTLGALCYAELGTTIPKSGGDYAYIAEAFGHLPAFLFLWVALVIVNPTSNAVIALTFSNYILKPFFEFCDIPNISARFLAACIIILLTFINCYNVRWSTRTQDWSTVTKIVALIFIVFAGIIFVLLSSFFTINFFYSPKVFFQSLDDDHHLNGSNFISNSEVSAVNLALGFYSGVFSFSGWNYLNFVTEEIKQPEKNLPRAIYISMPIVTIIYILVNISYFAVLTPNEILQSDAVAVSFAARLIGRGSSVVPLLVACSCIGTLNGIIFTSSRMFFAGARDGQLPELLAMINIKYFTPMPSLIFLGISSIFMLLVSDMYALINYLAFAESAVVTMGVAALLYLRYARPELPRPIKMSIIIPVSFFLMCLYVLFVPFLTSPTELLVAVAIIASGVPIYFVFIYNKKKLEFLYKIWVRFTQNVQKVLLCVTGKED